MSTISEQTRERLLKGYTEDLKKLFQLQRFKLAMKPILDASRKAADIGETEE